MDEPVILTMDYLELDTSNCSVGRTVEIIGAPWVILIVANCDGSSACASWPHARATGPS